MNNGSWTLRFAGRAERDLRQLDRPVRQRIYEALERLRQDPQTAGSLRRLSARVTASRRRLAGAPTARSGRASDLRQARPAPQSRLPRLIAHALAQSWPKRLCGAPYRDWRSLTAPPATCRKSGRSAPSVVRCRTYRRGLSRRRWVRVPSLPLLEAPARRSVLGRTASGSPGALWLIIA